MANFTSNLLGYPYGTQSGTSNATYFTTYPQTGTISSTPFGYTSNPAPVEREHKIEVPIIEKGDRAGLFLKGEHGELIHVDADRLYKALGIDW